MKKNLKIQNLLIFVLAFSILTFSEDYAFGQGIFTQYLDDAPGAAAATVTNLLTLLDRLACYAIRFGIISVGVAIIVYGLMFLTSRGNPQSLLSAKKALGWGIVGGLVIFGVFTIILSVSTLVGYDATGYTGYPILNVVNCSQ